MSDHKTRYMEMKEQCENFHRDHPQVWELFVRFTFELIGRGFKHYSAQHGVFSRIRWETDQADTDGNSIFKVNNNYSPFYARRFHKMYPEHDGFFRLRTQTSNRGPATGLPELSPSDYPTQ